MTLFGITPEDLRQDIYFRRDFLELHARPDAVDAVATENFCHGAAIHRFAGGEDLETPQGYGGPVATDPVALAQGLAQWRERQRRRNRVAEFIRLHPCLDPAPLAGLLDWLADNRPTVMVPLDGGTEARWRGYSKTTRNILRQTTRRLAIRPLDAAAWPLFQRLYESMLARHQAPARYWFPPDYYRDLLATPWARAWVATPQDSDEPLAASCFLGAPGCPLAHYHLSGGTLQGLQAQAQYPLLDAACDHYAAAGCRWLHLGGGRTPAPDDSLWLFKAKFSSTHARFRVAGLIYDPERYAVLGGGRDGQFLGYRVAEPPAQG